MFNTNTELAPLGGAFSSNGLSQMSGSMQRQAGREIERVQAQALVVDGERAPFVKLAFELYDKGEFSMEDIADILTDRGLETRATARRPAGPVSSSKISSMLRDPYYVGDIVYKGETFEGRHPAIIDRDLFVRVQRRLESSGRAGERKRVYPHYLKGTLWCGECYTVRGLVDKRMLIQRSNDMRRELNQAIFKRIFVLDQDRAESELQEPVRVLLEAQADWAASFGVGIDLETNENDAGASLDSGTTREDRLETVEKDFSSSKRSLVRVQGL